VDPAQRVQRVGLERLVLLRDLDPALAPAGSSADSASSARSSARSPSSITELASSPSASRAASGSPRATSAWALM